MTMKEATTARRLMGSNVWAWCLSVLFACVLIGGASRESSAAVIYAAGEENGSLVSASMTGTWIWNDRDAGQGQIDPQTVPSLVVEPSQLFRPFSEQRLGLGEEVWGSFVWVDQTPAGSTFTLLLGNGAQVLLLSPIGPVTFESHAPVAPLSSSPTSAALFVPALLGFLGVLLRERGGAGTSEFRQTTSMGERSAANSAGTMVLSSDVAFAMDVRDQLGRAGYAVQMVSSVDEALAAIERAMPSLLLVDHRLGGWDILRTTSLLRHVPVMVLVPCQCSYTEEACIADLERGADGIHDFQEGSRLFAAKVGAYLRRMGHDIASRGLYRMGAVELDADVHEVKVAGRPLSLSSKPFAILRTLMQAPSKVFSRHELIDRVWGPRFAIGEHTLDVHVHALRRHLRRDPNRLCQLVTIKGVGFKLKAMDSARSSSKMNGDSDTRSVAASGVPELRSTVDAEPRNSSVEPQRPYSTYEIPVLKRIARRRHAGKPRRSTTMSHLHRAALVG